MAQSYIKRILNAQVYDVARETPLDPAPLLSARLGNHALLKREDLQPVFSFKCRGAYNKMIHLDEASRAAGVVAASAGNHAQGVALAASKLGIKAKIVMPVTTPLIKVEAVRALGAKVVLSGDSFDDAAVRAAALVEAEGLTFIHPFDDPDVIAGQATVAVELVRQASRPLDYVFVCCGGGGLLAGMATYLRYVWPQTKIIGVEPEDAACVQAALHKGRRVTLREVGLFADGCAVAQVGKETFRLIRESVDDVMTVSTDEICAAVKDIFEDTRAIAEPAGALAVAGMKKYALQHRISGATMAATVSGANTNFDRLRYISERTEIGERREAVLSVTIPERPGAFRAFCNAIGKRNVTEFNYRYETAAAARVFVGLTVTPGDDSLDALQRNLREGGYRVLDLTDNETAKLHLRHMIGGRQPDDIGEEIVFRVEFPERPGSLLQFLNALGNEFSITLFHYRNHGAAYGRILVGMQVPPGKRAQLRKALLRLGYPFWEESDNPAYLEYLGRLNTD
ncbi:MAG: threonine ammonia-lyase, biosynthetic [Cellvibrionales bacterium TMED122]|nr:threonine ammonia-lyase, biosynthetic [Halieaceae bacterium]OUV65286.1 MAG: threonine ammonia-lyase, biosynthetic [Cellvibrionales bacterium TMED122]